MLKRIAALFQRIGAFWVRLRPSERNQERIWRVVIILAVVLPFAATGFEMARSDPFAALFYGGILVIWGTVMWFAWRSSGSGAPDLKASPQAPVQRAGKSEETKPGEQQASRS